MKDIEYRLNLMKSSASPHPPHSEEHAFYDLVAAGNTEEIEKLRKKYTSSPQPPLKTEKGMLSEDPLRNEIYHLIVNCTIVTRRCIAAGMPQEEAYTLSDLFIRRADRCVSVPEVQAVNDEMALEFASRMKRILSMRTSPAVRKAISYICDHLHTKLTVNEVAEKAGYNRSYLSGLFQRETGCSISEFILLKRIEAAKSLITGGTPLSEIAQILCFSSQSHFCQRFRAVTGISPGEYRRRAKTG